MTLLLMRIRHLFRASKYIICFEICLYFYIILSCRAVDLDPDPHGSGSTSFQHNPANPARRILAAACWTKVRWKKCLAGLASPTFLLLFPTRLSGSVSELGLWSYDFYAGFL